MNSQLRMLCKSWIGCREVKIVVPVIQFKWLFLFGFFSDGFFSFFFLPKQLLILKADASKPVFSLLEECVTKCPQHFGLT